MMSERLSLKCVLQFIEVFLIILQVGSMRVLHGASNIVILKFKQEGVVAQNDEIPKFSGQKCP